MASVEDWFVDGGHKSRLLLALNSGLPNEIDWALNKLVLLSFMCPDNFALHGIPSILDAILDHAEPYMRIMEREKEYDLEDLRRKKRLFNEYPLNSAEFERILQIFHIFRNFSFLASNLAYMRSSERLMKLIKLGLSKDSVLQIHEMRLNAIDIIENFGALISFESPDDPLFVQIKRMVHEHDRAIVLSAFRTLTRLCAIESNAKAFEQVDSSVLQRTFQLFFVWDEEMITAVMEFLYQYTGMFGSVPAKIPQALKGNSLIGSLIKFIDWQSPKVASKMGTGIRTLNPLTDDILTHRQKQFKKDQSARYCVGWWRNQVEPFESGQINPVELYRFYCAQAKALGNPAIEALGTEDFANCVKLAFPGVRWHIVSKSNEDNNFTLLINGLRTRVTHPQQVQSNVQSAPLHNQAQPDQDDTAIMGEKLAESASASSVSLNSTEPEKLASNAPEDDAEAGSKNDGNSNQAESTSMDVDAEKKEDAKSLDQEADAHSAQESNKIVDSTDSLNAPNGGNSEKPETQQQVSENDAAKKATQAGQNVNTPKKAPNKPDHYQGTSSDPNNSSSIPLCAALILRNLSRAKENHPLFLAFENDILRLITRESPELHQSVVKALTSILLEISKDNGGLD